MSAPRSPFALVAALLCAASTCACGSAERSDPADPPVCAACPPPDSACAPPPREAAPPTDLPAPSADRNRAHDLAGFSPDGRYFALRSRDEGIGASFTIFDADAGRQIDAITYDDYTEKTAWTRVERKYGVARLETSSAHAPQHDVTLVGGDTPAWVVVYALRGERAVAWTRIPRLTTSDGTPAAVALGRIAWDPTGAYAVVIHNQSMNDPLPFASDYVNIVRLDPARLPF